MTAPPITYFGGKTTLAPLIARLLPPHEHYVEPYGGSLAVLLAKRPSASRMETVNDLDQDIHCFWRVLRDQPDELQRVCALTPHSRTEYEVCAQWIVSADREPCSDVERARRVWVKLTQGRGGQLRSAGWRHYIDPSGSSAGMPAYLAGYVGRMAAVIQRLRHVSLECRPALDLIHAYGSHPEVCLYVDPPYLGETRLSGGYRHDMRGADEHRELADALTVCRASVVLSGYPSSLYEELYADWHRMDLPSSTGQGGTWANRTEVLWSNRPLEDQGSLLDLIGEAAS